MADEQLLTTVAVALTTETAQAITQAARDGLASLIRLMRRKFAGNPSAQQALELAQQDPSNADRVQPLIDALKQALADDPDFEAELRHAWREASTHLSTGKDTVFNTVSGTVEGNVIQARDVSGGISFGDTERRPT